MGFCFFNSHALFGRSPLFSFQIQTMPFQSQRKFPILFISTLFIIIFYSLAEIHTLEQIRKSSSSLEQIKFKGIKHFVRFLTTGFEGCEFIRVLQEPHYLNNVNLLTFLSKNSAGIQQVPLGSNITISRHEDIHRLSSKHCGVGLISLTEFNEDIENWLVETLIPLYGPLLRKDEDHFIIIAPEQISDLVLLSPKFGSKIKYKLALSYDESGGNILCKTVDLYGNGGDQQLTILAKIGIGEMDLKLKPNNYFPDMTKQFNGKVFRFAIPKVAFRFEIELRSDKKYHPKRGFYKWWLDEAMKKFNFTYHIFQASYGGGTGKRLENGTWVGATGDIYYGKADCSFIVGQIYSRHKYLGWSSAISYEWVVFLTHKPRKFYSPKAIFWSFTPFVWTLFFFSLILLTFALKTVAHAGFEPNDRNVIRWGYLEMLEYLWKTFLEQDTQDPFTSSSIRVLCAFWFIFAMVTSTAYKGKLVSLIAFPVNTWVPNTFQELANSNFRVALNVVGKAGAAYVMIASSTSPVFQAISSRMELIPEPEACLQRAMTEDMGCIIWKGIADYTAVKSLTDKNGIVPLQESSQIALFIGDGLVYERRAIFGEHLDRTIQATVQMGLTIKWFQLDEEFIKKERKIYESSSNTTKPIYEYDDGSPKKLILSQFTGLFLLVFGGLLISLGQFLIELVRYRLCRTRETFSS